MKRSEVWRSNCNVVVQSMLGTMNYSSLVKWFFLKTGFRWLVYESLRCLPDVPLTWLNQLCDFSTWSFPRVNDDFREPWQASTLSWLLGPQVRAVLLLKSHILGIWSKLYASTDATTVLPSYCFLFPMHYSIPHSCVLAFKVLPPRLPC